MKKGTALIYVLLISGIISAIGLAVARLSITEIRMTRLASESIAAYYAAEAGLEDGLARWRWDRNIQVSKEYIQGNSATEPTEGSGTGKEYSLDADRGYQLKIWYKAEKVGRFYAFAEKWDDPENPAPALAKDQVQEVDVLNQDRVILKYKPSGNTNIGRHGVEVIQIDKNDEVWTTTFFDQSQDSAAEQNGKTIQLSNNIKSIRIKPWDTDIKYAIKSSSGNIDSGYTMIESTGIFRGTKRKLATKIDRKSGTILDVYDFLLYGGEEIRQ